VSERDAIKRDLGHDATLKIVHPKNGRQGAENSSKFPSDVVPHSFAFGPFVVGESRYVTERASALNLGVGAAKRFGNRVAVRDADSLQEFADFTRRFCVTHLRPLQVSDDTSFAGWLQGRRGTYTEARRRQLAEMEEALSDYTETGDHREPQIGLFIKDESYGKAKASRGIANVSDQYLVREAPLTKCVEKAVFGQLPCFVKDVPVRERAAYAANRLGASGPFFANDFTSWEGLQTPDIMYAGEFAVYQYMVQSLGSQGRAWLKHVIEADTVEREYKNELLKVKLEGKRKSGSSQTSLGNGLNNMLLHAFFSWKYEWDSVGCFEGDDSIFSDPHGRIAAMVAEDLAHKSRGGLSPNPWTRLGILTKLEEHVELGTASFCGNVFDSYDETHNTMTEPIGKLIDFAWMPKKYLRTSFSYKMQLLRSKGLSMAYSYRAHPVLTAFSSMILRLTRGYRISQSIVDGMDSYKKEQYLATVTDGQGPEREEPTSHARWFVDQTFGLTPTEQRNLERMFDEKTDLSPIELPHGSTDFIDPKHVFQRVWDDCVDDNRQQTKMHMPVYASKLALKDLRLFSRLLTDANLRSLLPVSFNYEEVWSSKEESKTLRDNKRATIDALHQLLKV